MPSAKELPTATLRRCQFLLCASFRKRSGSQLVAKTCFSWSQKLVSVGRKNLFHRQKPNRFAMPRHVRTGRRRHMLPRWVINASRRQPVYPGRWWQLVLQLMLQLMRQATDVAPGVASDIATNGATEYGWLRMAALGESHNVIMSPSFSTNVLCRHFLRVRAVSDCRQPF